MRDEEEGKKGRKDERGEGKSVSNNRGVIANSAEEPPDLHFAIHNSHTIETLMYFLP